MACYLICFERPYRHARHYLGFAKGPDPAARIARHRAGQGARLIQVIQQAGIGWDVVRTWPEGTREDERRLKLGKNDAALCPRCKAAKRARQAELKRARRARRRLAATP